MQARRIRGELPAERVKGREAMGATVIDWDRLMSDMAEVARDLLAPLGLEIVFAFEVTPKPPDFWQRMEIANESGATWLG